jgi:hypothetical protein
LKQELLRNTLSFYFEIRNFLRSQQNKEISQMTSEEFVFAVAFGLRLRSRKKALERLDEDLARNDLLDHLEKLEQAIQRIIENYLHFRKLL